MSGNGVHGVHGALQLLRSLPKVSLANLRPNPGSKKPVSACGWSGGSWVPCCSQGPSQGLWQTAACPGELPSRNEVGW